MTVNVDCEMLWQHILCVNELLYTCLDVQPAGPRSSAGVETSASWSGRFSRSDTVAQRKSTSSCYLDVHNVDFIK